MKNAIVKGSCSRVTCKILAGKIRQFNRNYCDVKKGVAGIEQQPHDGSSGAAVVRLSMRAGHSSAFAVY